MKYSVRTNCFETNSSSMHSVVVLKNAKDHKDHDPVWNGKLRLWNHDLEFGRSPFEVLGTWDRKVAYWIALNLGYSDEETDESIKFIDELTEMVKKHVPEFDHFEFDEICYRKFYDKDNNEIPRYKVVHNNQLGEWEYMDNETDHVIAVDHFTDLLTHNDYGYVDHQSVGVLQSFLEKYNVTIEDFIFNDKYIMIIDGDEYNIYGDMVGLGLINESNIENEYGGDY